MSFLRLASVTIALLGAAFALPQGEAAKTEKSKPQVRLGQLGQALEAVSIKASPNTSSRTYYKVKQYEYLVVDKSKYAGWKKVLLQNGRYAYVKANLVADLPYDVTADVPEPARTGASMASRGTLGSTLVGRGLQYQGIRYVWGGTDPSKGIDCSAFVKTLFGEFGMKLPRTAAEQALVGLPIKRLEDLQPGDRLYFWSSSRNKIGHTGVYMGNGYFVHSSSGKGQVTTDYLGSPKWLKILVAARR